MSLDRIETLANAHRLETVGALHLRENEIPGLNSLLLFGPKEPGFWAHFTSQPEYHDGQDHPLDRWSKRVLGEIATRLGATAFFPLDGPPYHSFTDWARRSGRAHPSPVGLLVHDTTGLMISYRGALAFPERLDLEPSTAPSPCTRCEEKPCLVACPVSALQADHYDVESCKADLDRPGNDCMSRGCAVRRACPAGHGYARLEEQSAFHMRAFR